MVEITPLRKQYLELKRKAGDAILLFRLGDFYEMFDEDARDAARILQIVLTAREMGKGKRVPMCGVPHHAIDNYASRLLEAGRKVAFCEQVTPPGKGLVERQIQQIITPGTKFQEGMIDSVKNNYLVVAIEDKGSLGICYCDITTGELTVGRYDQDIMLSVRRELNRIDPAEVLSNLTHDQLGVDEDICSEVERWSNPDSNVVSKLYEVLNDLMIPSELDELSARTVVIAINYIRSNQPAGIPVFTNLRIHKARQYLELDEYTKRNLELTSSVSHVKDNANLFDTVDRTNTAMGGRLLRNRIDLPLVDVFEITRRLELVDIFKEHRSECEEVHKQLGYISDIERIIVRIRRGLAKKVDLLSLGHSLKSARVVAGIISDLPNVSHTECGDIPDCKPVIQVIDSAITDDPDRTIKPGYSRDLDESIELAAGARQWLVDYENELRKTSGIKGLKIGFNRVFGYYVEISNAILSTNTPPKEFQPRQTLANSQRFSTEKLKLHEQKVLEADQRVKHLEEMLYSKLLITLSKHSNRCALAGEAIAVIDVSVSSALISREFGYCRPEFSSEDALDIVGSRHPVVEATQIEGFVPNDCHLGGGNGQIIVLTGPNMAGKSTYLRQLAIIAVMAQAGMHVPADRAVLPIFDRVFTRVGARDDLAGGLSTFMVEMTELASILTRATRDSLVILDEIGRGTSTYDGLSIARSVIEYLHNHLGVKAKTVFATHYHELITLAQDLSDVRNFNMAVSENNGHVVFLRKVIPGGSDKSYGIHVARIAGVPKAVTDRAQHVLTQLEATQSIRESDLPTENANIDDGDSQLVEQIRALDLDSMSPLQALILLSELHREVAK